LNCDLHHSNKWQKATGKNVDMQFTQRQLPHSNLNSKAAYNDTELHPNFIVQQSTIKSFIF